MKKDIKIILIFFVLFMLSFIIASNISYAEYDAPHYIRTGVDSNVEDFEYRIGVNENPWIDNTDLFYSDNGMFQIIVTAKPKNGKIPNVLLPGNLKEYATITRAYNPFNYEGEMGNYYHFTIELDNNAANVDYVSLTIVEDVPINDGNNDNNNPGNNEENPPQIPTASAKLNYKVTGEIEYNDNGGRNPIGVDFSINNTSYRMDSSKLTYTEETAYEDRVDENGKPIPVMVPDENGHLEELKIRTSATITDDNITYDCDEQADKVKFTFKAQWNTIITSIKINNYNVPESKLPKTREELSKFYKNQSMELEIDNIDKADEYNIEIKARLQKDDEVLMGNFLWDYNEENGYTAPDDKIAHATLTFVKAEYNGTTITKVEDINKMGGLYRWDDVERKSSYSDEREGVGSATFPVGTKLTLALIPDAGYQLVNFMINDGKFTAEKEIGVYTFTVPGGNFHLSATFEKVDDAVNSKSDKIEEGSIKLGGIEKSMATGTARLDINDADLSEEQVNKFKNAAQNYKIENYLDISLYNTIYKGKPTDSWDTQVNNLDKEATITLKLDEGIDGKNLVIVHEKHDGTYEIIETVYDEKNHTITFKTKEFSNFAIATKNVEEKDTKTSDNKQETSSDVKKNEEVKNDDSKEEKANTPKETKPVTETSKNPTTGDNIIVYIAVFVISTWGLITTIKMKN